METWQWWQVVLLLVAGGITANLVFGAVGDLIATVIGAVSNALENRNRRRIDRMRTENGKMPVIWRDYDLPDPGDPRA